MTQDPGPDDNEASTPGTAPSETDKPRREAPNPAGPHVRPDLTDQDKTPGSGVLPEPGDANPSPTG